MKVGFKTVLHHGKYMEPTYYKCYMNDIYVGNYYVAMKHNPEYDEWSVNVWDKLSKEDRNNYPHHAHPPRDTISHYNILDASGRTPIVSFPSMEDVLCYFIGKNYISDDEKIAANYSVTIDG